MTDADRNKIAVAAVTISIVALLWAMLRNAPGVGKAIKYIESGAWLPTFAPIALPSFDGGDIIITPRDFAGDPFADIPLGGKGACGCQPFQCDVQPVGISVPSPALFLPAINVLPPEQLKLSSVCQWNATGYLSANPDVKEAFGTAGELKFRKKRKYPGTLDAWAWFHWTEWGMMEGRRYDC